MQKDPVDARGRLLELELQRRGALTARELAGSLGVHQSTLSRMLARLPAGAIHRLGRARSTRYAMTREIAGLGCEWPLYEIGTDGRAGVVGHLHALHAGQWCLAQDKPWGSLRGDEFRDGLYPDLPWFLDDLRPQGFLGRLFARVHGPMLGLPDDPRLWRSDDVVAALVRHGRDLQGAFILGGDMMASVQEHMLASDLGAIPSASRQKQYPTLADAALADEWPGSSAAGEQPKFTACVGKDPQTTRHVIVKFSGAEGRPEDERWADLLAAEHIAAMTLSEGGVPAARTDLLEGGGRRFLESERFDRKGAHGRKGLVSLAALDAAFFGQADMSWADAAARLRDAGWLNAEDADQLVRLYWFGILIGNTDMHYGNIGLFLGPDRPLKLAPAYDMVPMLYRPDTEGRLPERRFAPTPPPPEAVELWSTASELAERFWLAVSEEPKVSRGFRVIAGRNAEVVSGQRRQFAGGAEQNS